ncbi:MAG TPA: hypothetical protein DD649_19790 [Providencia sp.]|uniref:hypothetical protein n=1 Tax=unclassified Providencia TaxID=2633465 RepID=UPI000E8E9B2F|nr:hypothetical protein [Providencia sp.]MBP6080626.1 hypothetical protein [Providencia sp.]HBO25105.1 hypothetical protein [Providencia sp.]
MRKKIQFGITILAFSFSFYSMAQNSQPSHELDKVCKSQKQEMADVYENGALTECYFKNASLLQAYEKYRSLLGQDDQSFLSSKLVLNKNLETKCSNDNCISVNYNWDGIEKLNIEQVFAGGETHLEFNQDKKGTRLEIRYFPD